MELVNEFTVNRPIDEAWAVLTDVERIAPCLPGAQLQEIEGDIFRGVVKVKVGPISAALKGEATFVERDDTNHKAVLKGDGRDTKGNGNASALITATLEPLTATSAKCVVHTDLNMTGKVAQFGRGALGDISSKLMQQFAKNLDTMLAEEQSSPTRPDPVQSSPVQVPTQADAPSTAVAAAATVGAETAATPEKTAAKPKKAAAVATEATPKAATAEVAPPTSDSRPADAPATVVDAPKTPTVRTINGPAAEPIDAFSLGGSAVLKRLLPALAGLVILLLALRRLRK